jgi:hypothetical protein
MKGVGMKGVKDRHETNAGRGEMLHCEQRLIDFGRH